MAIAAAHSPAPPNASQVASRLKMKDLERATGVGRETIRFYIHAGLLPEPHRLGRNVAWYDASFVERVRLIKELQQKRFLPLRVIRTIIEGDSTLAPAEVQTLLDLDRHLFRAAGIDLHRTPVKLAEVARRTGVSAAAIRQLARLGALEITARGRAQWLHDPDVRIVELWARLRSAGFTEALGFRPENMRLYVDMVRWLVREEVRVFARGVTGKTDRRQFTGMAEAAIEILNQLISVLRTGFLLRHIGTEDLAASPAQPPMPTRRRNTGSRRRSSPLSLGPRGTHGTDAS